MRRLHRRRIRRMVVVLIDWRRRRVTIVRCTRVRTVVANSETMKVSRHGSRAAVKVKVRPPSRVRARERWLLGNGRG